MAKAGLLFVGTDDGMVLFSDPGGVGRWLRIGQELRGRSVRAIWPAADTPLTVLAAVDGGGLQRSEDGGQSWQLALDAQALAITGGDRHEPGLMYVCTRGGEVFRSEDAGAAWAPCARGPWPAGGDARLIADHGDARKVYLGLDDGTVWVGSDGGSAWASYGSALSAGVDALAEDPSEPGSLYALAGGALYRCAGAAAAWRMVERAPQGNVLLAVLAGKQPALLLAGGGIARSDDGGASWAAVGQDVAWESGVSALTPVPYHIDMALAGSGGGQLAQSADRGRTWHVLKHGLGPIRAIAAARLV
jgi:hypothetical protein